MSWLYKEINLGNCGNTGLELGKFRNIKIFHQKTGKNKRKRENLEKILRFIYFLLGALPWATRMECEDFSDFFPLNKNAFILVNALSGHRYHRSAARTSIYYFTMRSNWSVLSVFFQLVFIFLFLYFQWQICEEISIKLSLEMIYHQDSSIKRKVRESKVQSKGNS